MHCIAFVLCAALLSSAVPDFVCVIAHHVVFVPYIAVVMHYNAVVHFIAAMHCIAALYYICASCCIVLLHLCSCVQSLSCAFWVAHHDAVVH